MGLLTITPTHYEGLFWMAGWFILVAALPLFNSFYNSGLRYVPVIPMQSSLLQTSTFVIFMLSIYCAASMLPCGRYYYDPEGGYVGNPWVKFSYQYAYLYLGWIIHHLDVLEHYAFQYARDYTLRSSSLYARSFGSVQFSIYADPKALLVRARRSRHFKNISDSWIRK